MEFLSGIGILTLHALVLVIIDSVESILFTKTFMQNLKYQRYRGWQIFFSRVYKCATQVVLHFDVVFIQIFSHSSYWQEKCRWNLGIRSFSRKCQVHRCQHIRSYAEYSIDDLLPCCICLKTFAPKFPPTALPGKRILDKDGVSGCGAVHHPDFMM